MKSKYFTPVVWGISLAVVVPFFLGLVFFSYERTLRDSITNEITKIQKDLPMRIDDGMTLVEAFESGNIIYYVVQIDSEMSKEDFQMSQFELDESKRFMITYFREDMGRDMEQLKQLIDGIVYVYRNNNGEELFRISINKSEL